LSSKPILITARFLAQIDQSISGDNTKLQEEVTRALAAVVMAETRAASKERMAQERVVLLAPARDKADGVDKRVSALEDELMAVR
jgi:hypothetical protein